MSTVIRTTGPLNKTDLGEAVAAELGVSHEQGHRAVAAVLNTIARTVASGHQVAVTNFGTWRPVYRPAHKAHNPQTLEHIHVQARTRLAFRVSAQLQDAVNAGDPDAAVITKRSRAMQEGTR